MTKKVFLLMFTCFLLNRVSAQSAGFDTVAVSILDHMSRTMSELKSLSATVKTNYDVGSRELGLIKHSDIEHVYIDGPDKLLITCEGDKGNKHFYYNDNTLSYYSVDKNQYARVRAPGSVVDMIDSMNRKYGIVFPMADFLYPTFVDDILAEANSLVMLGVTKVDGKDCFHIAGVTKNKTFQFWITDDPFYMPVKLVIVYTNRPMNPQMEATSCDIKVNPDLPASIFEFDAPPGAQRIKLSAKGKHNND
jgi:hypothetical protein